MTTKSVLCATAIVFMLAAYTAAVSEYHGAWKQMVVFHGGWLPITVLSRGIPPSVSMLCAGEVHQRRLLLNF